MNGGPIRPYRIVGPGGPLYIYGNPSLAGNALLFYGKGLDPSSGARERLIGIGPRRAPPA
jgi:hypothetical protein